MTCPGLDHVCEKQTKETAATESQKKLAKQAKQESKSRQAAINVSNKLKKRKSH
jgi:hypothetical protein